MNISKKRTSICCIESYDDDNELLSSKTIKEFRVNPSYISIVSKMEYLEENPCCIIESMIITDALNSFNQFLLNENASEISIDKIPLVLRQSIVFDVNASYIRVKY